MGIRGNRFIRQAIFVVGIPERKYVFLVRIIMLDFAHTSGKGPAITSNMPCDLVMASQPCHDLRHDVFALHNCFSTRWVGMQIAES